MARGNLSFTSLNLVRIALTSDTINVFFEKLEEYVAIVIRQLYDRFLFQSKKLVKDFSFLHGQGVWKDSEKLGPDEMLHDVLRHGSLSIGFIGLAECLKALTGKHHGECDKAQHLGQQIVAYIREKCDIASEQYDLNYTLIATPAEGLSGKFTKKDKEEFGLLASITDKEYYTNSFHIPVHFPIRAIDKIKKESVYHSLTNAGHITYIEVDGNVRNNIKAMDTLIKAMAEYGIGYGSINHPVDRCKCCGYSGVIENECPTCYTTDDRNIDRIRRITGYLVGTMEKWNTAKAEEEKHRVRHS